MSTQIQISGVTTYENVRIIDAIVDEAEMGIYVNSARLVDQVLRDARIYSTLMTRIGGLLGKALEFEPAEPEDGRNKSTADKSATEAETLWPQMFEHSALVELLLWGLMQGVGVAQIVEGEDVFDDEGNVVATMPLDPWRLDVWHPWALTWDEYRRQYYIQTREDSKLYLVPDGKGGFRDKNGTRWVLFTPFGYGNSGRRCYLRCLHRLSNERQWTHRDRARFLEIFGQPIRFGIAPKGSTKDERTEYKRRLNLQGAEAVIVGEQGEDGNRWDLKLVQANAASASELFDVTMTQLDKEIATLFLGQSQTTDGQAGLGANEMAGEPVRLDVMSSDNSALGGTLRTQFLMPYWEFSYGKASLAPWPCWKVVPPEDGAKKTLEFKQLMEGFVAAQKAGAPVDMRATMEGYGYPMVTEAQQKALDAEAAAQEQKAAQDAANKTPPTKVDDNA